MDEKIKHMTYRISTNIEISELDSEGVILKLDTGEFFSLNPIGVDILKLIKKKNNLEEITEKIANKYEQGKEEIKKDSQEFIKKLIKNNIIEKNY